MQSPVLSANLTAQAVNVAICPSTAFFARSKLCHRPRLQHRTGNRQNKRLVITGTYSTTKPEDRPHFKSPQLPATPEVVNQRDLPSYLVLPEPADYQQTIRQSFTVGGLGYHTGEYAHVRVRPAHAGEGRYFVRKSLGTNSHLFRMEPEEQIQLHNFSENPNEEPNDEDTSLELELYFKYLGAQADGFDGDFGAFVEEEMVVPAMEAAVAQKLIVEGDEEVVTRSEEDECLLATLDSVPDPSDIRDKERAKYYTTLAQGEYPPAPIIPQVAQFFNDFQQKMAENPDFGLHGDDSVTPEMVQAGLREEAEKMVAKEEGRYFEEQVEREGDSYQEQQQEAEQQAEEQSGMWVQGAEHLLAALEGMGVDNARIEIEGGNEVPIIDGSALGWVIEIQKAQLRAATLPEVAAAARPAADESTESSEEASTSDATDALDQKNWVNKEMLAPKKAISLRRGDAFMMFFPQTKRTLTYGIDYTDVAPVIGKQWYSWAPYEDDHFRWNIAPARTFNSSPMEMVKLKFDLGLMKGGSEGCANNAYKDLWTDMDSIRFPADEPVRHKMLDLVGDLALLGENGHSGLPLGHIIAYKADHSMHIEFLKALKASCGPDDRCPSVDEYLMNRPPGEEDPVQAAAEAAAQEAEEEEIEEEWEDDSLEGSFRQFGYQGDQGPDEDSDDDKEEDEDEDDLEDDEQAGVAVDEEEDEEDADEDDDDEDGDDDEEEEIDSDDDDRPSKGRSSSKDRK